MRTTLPMATAFLATLIGAGIWYVSQEATDPAVPLSALSFGEQYEGALLSENYRNEEFHFSLDMPGSFSAREFQKDENGALTIVLENAGGDGIQMYVSPAGDERILTASDVQAAIPDMKVLDAQAVEIGNDYRGVAFRSDNDAFGGDSREVWFYYGGNLYQISTYVRLDSLLQAMFATWTFF